MQSRGRSLAAAEQSQRKAATRFPVLVAAVTVSRNRPTMRAFVDTAAEALGSEPGDPEAFLDVIAALPKYDCT